MFDFDVSDKLQIKISKLIKKDKKKAEILQRKIKEIIINDAESIKRYKNLRHDLSEYKRVHIENNFVLAFTADLENNFILFYDFDHHDKIYENLAKK